MAYGSYLYIYICYNWCVYIYCIILLYKLSTIHTSYNIYILYRFHVISPYPEATFSLFSTSTMLFALRNRSQKLLGGVHEQHEGQRGDQHATRSEDAEVLHILLPPSFRLEKEHGKKR